MEGNNWHKIHQETLHKLLVVTLSYYQKGHSLSDLRENMTNLISQDELKIPKSFLGWTNDYLHTHTNGVLRAQPLNHSQLDGTTVGEKNS
jgi:hypothetical protein